MSLIEQQDINRGIEVFREEGPISFLRKATNHVIDPNKWFPAKVRDYLIRRWLADVYTLPIQDRRIRSYIKSIRQGPMVVTKVQSDLGRYFDDNTRILDVGCGDGAVAGELARSKLKLDYTGLDINERWMSLLNKRFRDWNFDFIFFDVKNHYFNPNGEILPKSAEFPVPDNRFDVIMLNAVFPHMGPEGIQRYLEEFARVLDTDGLVWISVLLARNESDRDPNYDLYYEVEHDGYYSTNIEPSAEIGRDVLYPEEMFYNMVKQAGLRVEETHYGSWRERSRRPVIDDTVVLAHDD